MTRPKCLATRNLPGNALTRLAHSCDLQVWKSPTPPSPEQLLEMARDVDGLLCLLSDRIDSNLIASCPRLRVISNYAVGLDNIDLSAARAAGIQVGHTPDVLTDSTADLAIALMLALARRIPEGIATVKSGGWGAWDPSFLLGRDLYGATLGVIGAGRIGGAVIRRAEAFSMHVLSAGRTTGTPLPELLERCDFVSLHCPLTPATAGLIDAAALSRMKPTAYLINTSRGGVVDTKALAAALHSSTIAGAALDVTDPEPLPPDHFLLACPNLLVVPHIGSATHETRERMAEIAVENLLAGLAGTELPHKVPLV